MSELQRNTVTSDAPNYVSLDTDFIVGTAIRFFEVKGYRCEWRHLDNDPNLEIRIAGAERPILQHHANGRIKTEFRLFNNQIGYWKEHKKTTEGIQEAENGIFALLDDATCESGRRGDLTLGPTPPGHVGP